MQFTRQTILYTTIHTFFLLILFCFNLTVSANQPIIQLGYGRVTCATISLDGSKIVSGSTDGIVRLWDATTHKVIQTYSGHTGEITSLALTVDGLRLVSGSADKTARVWDVTTGVLKKVLIGHHGPIQKVAISSDYSKILTGSTDSTACLWDSTGSIIRYFPILDTRTLELSTSGNLVFTEDHGVIRVWDPFKGIILHSFSDGKYQVTNLALSKNDSILVTINSSDSTIEVWNVKSGELIKTYFKKYLNYYILALSGDGGTLYFNIGQGYGTLLNLKDGTSTLINFPECKNGILSLSLTMNGTQAIVTDWNLLSLINLKTNTVIHRYDEHSASADYTSANKDFSLLLTGFSILDNNENIACLYNCKNGEIINSFTLKANYGSSVAISPDGSQIAFYSSSDSMVKLINTYSGTFIKSLPRIRILGSLLAFSPTQSDLVACGSGHMYIWDYNTGALLKSDYNSESEISLSFANSRDRFVRSSRYESSVYEKDSTTYKVIQKFEYNSSGGYAGISGDGSIVLTAWNNYIYLWNVETGQKIAHYNISSSLYAILTAAISPDGSTAVVSLLDSTARIIELKTGKMTNICKEQSFIRILRFWENGKKILTGTDQGITKLWSIPIENVSVSEDQIHNRACTPALSIVNNNSFKIVNLNSSFQNASFSISTLSGQTIKKYLISSNNRYMDSWSNRLPLNLCNGTYIYYLKNQEKFFGGFFVLTQK